MSVGTAGGIPLRPLSLGEIFNGAVTSMRRSPAASLGIAALLSVVAGIAPALAASNIARLRLTATVGVNVANLVVGFILNVLLYGMLALVVGRTLQGTTTSLRQAWQLTRPRLRALLATAGLLLLIYFALWIPFVLVLVVAVGTSQPVAIALAVLVGLATVLAEVVGWVLLSLAAIVVVLEQAGPVLALRRSWQLVRARFWRVFGILLLAAIVYFVAGYVLALPFTAAQAAVLDYASPHLSALAVLFEAIGVIIAGAITRPFLAGVTALVYCDLRMRREGLDLIIAGAAGQQGAGDAALIWAPPAASPTDNGQPGEPAW